MKRFSIFIKSKKFKWTANNIALLIFAILFVAFQVNKNIENPIGEIVIKYIGIIGLTFYIAGLIYKFTKLAKPDKLHGKLVGFLELKSDSIKIDQDLYNINDIKKIIILNNDYYGKSTGSGKGFNSSLSNGVDNHFTIILNDNKKVSCMFEIYYENDIRKLDEVLINYYSLGKMDFNHLVTVLKLKSNEIEGFKRIYNIKSYSH